MNLDSYQEQAMRTNHWPRVYTEAQVREMLCEARDCLSHEGLLDKYETPLNLLIYPLIGLLGEAGEVAEKMKKIIRDDGGNITEDHISALVLELGDVGWYRAAMSAAIGKSESEVAQTNLDKLASRRARGVLKGSGDDR